jgi:predicted nucleic acid-binding protein
MEIALFDSNIVIDALNGVDQAVVEIRYYKRRVVSSITWMEAITKPLSNQIAGLITDDRMLAIHTFVSSFTVIHTDDDIMREAASLRASSLLYPPKVLLPDAIIHATANVTGYLLVTRNKKDFRGANLRYPYDLQDGRVFNVAPPPSSS